MAEPKIYYCDQCFHIRCAIIEMFEELEGTVPTGHYECPHCQGTWRLNQGQARHVVSLKLQLYRRLADKLGMLKIEEEKNPYA